MPVDRNTAMRELIRRGAITQEQAAQLGYQPPQDMGGMEVLGGGYKRAPTGQLFKEGRSGSMTRVAGPTDTQIDKVAGDLTGANDALMALDRVDKAYRRAGYLGPSAGLVTPELMQSVNDLAMRLKETYNLGVLNGPDLPLLRTIIGDPGKLKYMALEDNFSRELRGLARIIGDDYRAKARKFEATGGKADALQIPLYQAPDSQYTPEQWGTRGKVPRDAYEASVGLMTGSRRPSQPQPRPQGGGQTFETPAGTVTVRPR